MAAILAGATRAPDLSPGRGVDSARAPVAVGGVGAGAGAGAGAGVAPRTAAGATLTAAAFFGAGHGIEARLPLMVATFLTAADLGRAAPTCRALRDVCADPAVWRHRLFADFDVSPPLPPPPSLVAQSLPPPTADRDLWALLAVKPRQLYLQHTQARRSRIAAAAEARRDRILAEAASMKRTRCRRCLAWVSVAAGIWLPALLLLAQFVLIPRKLDGEVTASWWAVGAPTWALILLTATFFAIGAIVQCQHVRASQRRPVRVPAPPLRVPPGSRTAAALAASSATRTSNPQHNWWYTLPETLRWFPPTAIMRHFDVSEGRRCFQTRAGRCLRISHLFATFLFLAAIPLVLVTRFELGATVALSEGLRFPWGVAFIPIWLAIALLACCCCTIRMDEDFIPSIIGIWTTLLCPLAIVLIILAVSLDYTRAVPLRLMFIPFWLWMSAAALAFVVACCGTVLRGLWARDPLEIGIMGGFVFGFGVVVGLPIIAMLLLTVKVDGNRSELQWIHVFAPIIAWLSVLALAALMGGCALIGVVETDHASEARRWANPLQGSGLWHPDMPGSEDATRGGTMVTQVADLEAAGLEPSTIITVR